MWKELTDFLKTRKKMNLLIVIVNIAVFLLMEMSGNTEDVGFMLRHGAMYGPAVLKDGEYYRLFTGMFLHFGLQHLAYNMMLLLFAGNMLEDRIGWWKYLLVYLGGGMAGNLLSFVVNLKTGSDVVSAGASGAIFAVLGALVYIVIRHKGKAPGLNNRGICAMAVLSLAQGFSDAGVDNMAHLGGAVGGFLLAVLLYRVRTRKKEPDYIE